jgi:EpsI family protein
MTTTLSPHLPQPTAEPATRANGGSLSRAIWLAVACVALIQGGGWVVKALFLTSTARAPLHALSDLPHVIGPWSGTELQVDAAFANVGAIDHNERRYSESAGAVVFVHRAAWTSQDDWTPHTPELCYTNNGWELLQSETTTLPDTPAVHLVIQHYQQGVQRVAVAYWYQLEAGTYVDRNGARQLHRTLWGRREWPPLVKTLLQTNETGDVQTRLLDLARRIYEFNREL